MDLTKRLQCQMFAAWPNIWPNTFTHTQIRY